MKQPNANAMVSKASEQPESQRRFLETGVDTPRTISCPENILTLTRGAQPGITPEPPNIAPPSAKAAPQRGRRFVNNGAGQTAPRDLSAAQPSYRGSGQTVANIFANNGTAQSRLEARFAGLMPSDFGDPGILVYTALDLTPPPGFADGWVRIDARDIKAIFTKEHIAKVHDQGAILILGDGHDETSMEHTCKLAEQLDTMKDGCPPIIWAQHTLAKENTGVRPRLQVYDGILKHGVDDIVVGEPKGTMFAVAVRSRLGKIFSISDKVGTIINDRLELSARAFTVEACLKDLVWDYLRRRLQTGLPPQEPDCPPGIPSTIDGLSVGPRLGMGASGEVFPLVVAGRGASTEVIKCISKADITHIGGLKNLKHQLKLMRLMSVDCPHNNVVKFYQVYHIDTHILFRMENGGSMNLFKRLRLREEEEDAWPMPCKKVQALIEQCVGALAHMHACQVSHRDIKPENVCLKETADGLTVKLCDFDVAVQCSHNQKVDNLCGTFPFTAPEVHLKDSYFPFPADIWSLGIMYAEVLCGLHLLERVLHLSAQRCRFEQDNSPRTRRDKMAAKRFLTQKIKDYFHKPHAASDMIECWAREDANQVVAQVAQIFDKIIVDVAQRSTAKELMGQFARNMHGNAPQRQ